MSFNDNNKLILKRKHPNIDKKDELLLLKALTNIFQYQSLGLT